MSAEIEEEDVNTLSFGADFDGAVFLPNSSIALLLQKIAEKKYGERAPPEYVGCRPWSDVRCGSSVAASKPFVPIACEMPLQSVRQSQDLRISFRRSCGAY